MPNRKTTPLNPRARRRRHDPPISQRDFWKRIGITQSGGSRYEKAGRAPAPIDKLVRLAFPVDRAEFVDTLSGVNPFEAACYKSKGGC